MSETQANKEGAGPSIAVLPFDNMSGDAEQEYFSDGITEDIITDLSKVNGLMVVARNSSFAFKGQSKDIREIGRALGVRSVLEGSVRRTDNRVRITAQLIDATTGGHLWANRYDCDLDDIFGVQDRVTEQIVSALTAELSPAEKNAVVESQPNRPPTNPAAHDALLMARELLAKPTKTREIFNEMISLFERAIEIDPSSVGAQSGLAHALAQDYLNRYSDNPDGSLGRADRIARRSLALDPQDPYANTVAAMAAGLRRELDRVVPLLKTALKSDPNSALANSSRGYYEIVLGRPGDSIAYFEKAMKLDPVGRSLYLHNLGMAHLLLGRHQEAVEYFQRRIAEGEDVDVSQAYLASSLGHLGRTDEARTVWEELKAVNPSFSIFRQISRLPFQNPATAMPIVEGIRKAGLTAQ